MVSNISVPVVKAGVSVSEEVKLHSWRPQCASAMLESLFSVACSACTEDLQRTP